MSSVSATPDSETSQSEFEHASVLRAQHAANAYSERAYWDERYMRCSTSFEWYHNFGALKPVLDRFVRRQEHVLHVGVGSSTLQEDMALDGYAHITNIDFSRTAIRCQQSSMWSQPRACRLACTYHVADVRRMPGFQRGAFGAVIDKGTLDSMLCGPLAAVNAAAMMTECSRVLTPGGVLLVFSASDPNVIMRHLDDGAYGWDVSVFVLSSFVLDEPEAELRRKRGDRWVCQGREKTCVHGPFLDPVALAVLHSFEHVLFAYACVKRE